MTNNGTVQNGMDGENLAAFCGRLSTIIYSPPSFPVRLREGVCDTPLHFYYLFVGDSVMDGVGL